jgi:hypothetical protein
VCCQSLTVKQLLQGQQMQECVTVVVPLIRDCLAEMEFLWAIPSADCTYLAGSYFTLNEHRHHLYPEAQLHLNLK